MDIDSYSTEFEGRRYLNPNVALQEQTDFITNLRNVQQQNNAQINADTRNLGTDIASSMGGLLGSDSYFTSRYQVPQSVAAYNDLTAAARASALSQALKNEQEKWNQRYRRARSANYRRSAGGGGGNVPTTISGGVNIDNGNYSVAWDRIASEIARKQYLANIEAAKQQLQEDTAEAMTVAPTPEYQNKNWQLPTPTFQGGF